MITFGTFRLIPYWTKKRSCSPKRVSELKESLTFELMEFLENQAATPGWNPHFLVGLLHCYAIHIQCTVWRRFYVAHTAHKGIFLPTTYYTTYTYVGIGKFLVERQHDSYFLRKLGLMKVKAMFFVIFGQSNVYCQIVSNS